MSHNPFARPKPNPKRDKARCVRGRVRLKDEWLKHLRLDTAIGAREHCQTCGAWAPYSSGETWIGGELSHLRHGPNKTDTLEGCIWECKPCHRRRHNAGGKPCPRKAGREMNQTEALAYWRGDKCFCTEKKRPDISFCGDCLLKLSTGNPQLHHDVLCTSGDDYLKALALAESFLLAWKPAEEHA